jgi:25S rRNA (adenine2142-N1)-methyltransferase
MPPNKRAKKQPVTQQYIKNFKGSDHQKLISKFHQLNKKKSDLENELKLVKNQKKDRIRVKKEIDGIQSELDGMGGLIIYQKASQIGEKRFNSSKWLMQELTSNIKQLNQIKVIYT